jgi:hypothetical protein
VGPQQGVERHRDDARLDRAPEEVIELGPVLDDHQDPLAAADAETDQGVAGAVDVLGQRAVGDLAAVDLADRDLLRTPLLEVPVDEGDPDIEGRGKGQTGRCRRSVDRDAVVTHQMSSRFYGLFPLILWPQTFFSYHLCLATAALRLGRSSVEAHVLEVLRLAVDALGRRRDPVRHLARLGHRLHQ